MILPEVQRGAAAKKKHLCICFSLCSNPYKHICKFISHNLMWGIAQIGIKICILFKEMPEKGGGGGECKLGGH